MGTHTSNLTEGVDVTIVDLNDYDLTIYGIDLGKEKGISEPVHQFLNLINDSSGIMLSLAEHRSTYSITCKNIFDCI